MKFKIKCQSQSEDEWEFEEVERRNTVWDRVSKDPDELADRVARLEIGKARRTARELHLQIRSFHLMFNEKQLALIDALFEHAEIKLDKSLERERSFVLAALGEEAE